MMRVEQAVIVEGKYDRLRVEKVLDALIIETKGFRIFKDSSKREYIKKLAAERGLLILTDSDSAGFLIRNHLKSFIPENQIRNAYVPRIEGKEKRKVLPSKEGILGVEAMDNQRIEEAVRLAGVTEQAEKGSYTAVDLYNMGLTGRENSRERREKFLSELGLPTYLSTRDILKYMNLNAEEIQDVVAKYL